MINLKIELLAIIVVLGLISCQTKNDSPNTPSEKPRASKRYEHFKLDVKKWRKEYLPLDSIKVFGCRANCDSSKKFNFFTNDSLSIQFPKITLNNKTRASQIGQLFPESCKLTKPVGNVWSGKIELFVSHRDYEQRVWVLIFYNETLAKMYLYDPFEAIHKTKNK